MFFDRYKIEDGLYSNAFLNQISIKERHSKILSFIFYSSFLIGLISASFTILNLNKILHWQQTVDFGDYSLSVRDWGKGGPTVIIEGGLDQPKHKYFLISFFSSNITRTIAYDHAGVGDSTSSHEPRTLPNYVKELRRLMKKLKLHPPFILIGHSSGGHIVRYYTYLYPKEVAGLILIDSPPTKWFKHIRQNWTKKEIKKYFEWWYPDHPDMTNIKILEKHQYENNCNLLDNIIIPKNIPVLMFTGNNVRHFRKDKVGKEADYKAWIKMQHALITNLDDAKQIIDTKIGHYPFKDKPVMVMSEIDEFVRKIKSKYRQH